MYMFAVIFFIAVVFYKLYAIPLAFLFAFFLTRRLARSRSSTAARWIALAWTVGLFAPLVSPTRTFFHGIYVPWYLAFLLSPPAPQFSVGALAIAIVVSLTGSAAALFSGKR